MKKRMNKKVAKTVGPKFKELRKKLHVSLKDLVNQTGVSSRSTLSRWERGEEGLSVEIFERLISSLNISYSEIIINEVDIKNLINKIEYLYQVNDTKELRILAINYLQMYEKADNETSHVELLFKSAISMNYYLDLTQIDLSDKKFRLELKNRVKNIQYWFKKEIVLFGNVQLLLDVDTIYDLGRSLASESYEKEIVSMDISITLLNAVFILIKKKAPIKARKLLSVTSKLNFSNNDLLVKIRVKFMNCLLQYIDNGSEHQTEIFLNSLENETLKRDYYYAFLQVKQIYQS